ncbi:virulence factor TspB C-terminal domain-related protein [Simonsiella muelleri]|uniref:virulence factor TspB C-terminal domain-related protein n=1 Tax=Simonsiella muelleri TaxID=72 RepID=UPI0037DA32A6
MTLITVKILGTNHEISYWPFCDAAIKLCPIIILVSIFLSFIVVRSAILLKD